MKSSCIQHPEREPLVILRKSYVELCGGDRCAAVLLANFEYWHNVKLDQSEQEVARARDNPDYKPDLSLWVYKSTADLIDDLLGQYARDKVMASVRFLLDKGYLETKADPRSAMSRVRFFLFVPDAVNSDLMLRPSAPIDLDSRKIDCRQSKNRPSVKPANTGRTIVDNQALDGRISDSLPYTETTHQRLQSSSSSGSSGAEEDEDLAPLSQSIAKHVVAAPSQVQKIAEVVRASNPDLSPADIGVAVDLAVPPGYQVRFWKYFLTALPPVLESARFLQELQRSRSSRAISAAGDAQAESMYFSNIESLLALPNGHPDKDDLRNFPAADIEEVSRHMRGPRVQN